MGQHSLCLRAIWFSFINEKFFIFALFILDYLFILLFLSILKIHLHESKFLIFYPLSRLTSYLFLLSIIYLRFHPTYYLSIHKFIIYFQEPITHSLRFLYSLCLVMKNNFSNLIFGYWFNALVFNSILLSHYF